MGKKTSLDAIAKGLTETKSELDKQIADVTRIKKDYEEKNLAFLSGGAPHIHTTNRGGNSYEQGLLQKFRCKSLQDLLNVDTSISRAADDNDRMAVCDIKTHFQTARFISQVFHGAPLDRGDMVQDVMVKGHQGFVLEQGVPVRNIFDSHYAKEYIVPLLKTFDSTTPGAGAEWVPTALSTNFIPEFELERRIANEIQDIQMTTNPWELPVQTDVTTARIIAENTAMTGASFSTSKLTWTAKKYGEFYPLPEEMNEDSAPNIMAIGKNEIIEAQIRARETALLNGDDSVTHMDADTAAGAADLAEKGFHGYRKLSTDNSANGGTVDFSGAAVTTANLDQMINQMGKFGVNPRDVYFAFGSTGYNQAVVLPEVTSVEKFGPAATILSGALSAFRGKPVLISDFIREDLNATGVEDGITTDRTVVHAINRKRFWLGIRRPIRSRVMMDLANQDRWLLASYQRMDMQGLPQSATEVSVVTGVNILV